jgi:hypothetical protein
MASSINFAGVTVDTLFTELQEVGVTPSDAQILAAAWILENVGRTQRVFNFQQDFPAEESECQPDFDRTFDHQHFIDGETVVAASASAVDQGFNWRFDRITDDLDALHADVAKAFQCMAEMRQSLRVLLDEIRAELNRLNSDVHDCCHGQGGGGSGVGPVVGSIGLQGGLLAMANYLGPGEFNDQTVSIWQTQQGVMMLPAVQSIGVEAVTGPRIQKAGKLMMFVEENPKVRETFPDSVSVEEFTKVFADTTTSDGTPIPQIIDILPTGAKYESLEVMADTIAEFEATYLKTTDGARAAIAQAFDLQTGLDKVSEASIVSFQSIPVKARNVLLRHDIDTVGKIADADIREIVALLNREGVQAKTSEAANWKGIASTLARIG